jgi:diguanylate cyclase (GGDEF)-like protein
MHAIFRRLTKRFGDTAEALRSPIPWITLSAGIALSVAVWIGLERNRLEQAQALFDRQAHATELAVRTRLMAYEQMALVAAAHVAAMPVPTRRSWRDFATQLDLPRRFPGVQAIGYAERVPASARDAHVKRVRSDGVAGYDIAPAGARSQYFPIALSEPDGAAGARGVGFDVFTDPGRRAAMERARDSGEAAITGPIVFGAGTRAGERAEGGFILYVPVFTSETPPATALERADALAGFVCAILHMPQLMRGVLGADSLPVLDVRVLDDAPDAASTALFDTRPEPRADAAFSRQVAFPFDGRAWTIVFTSRPDFEARVAKGRSWGMLAWGLGASLLLSILTVMLVGTWNRTHQASMRDPLTGLYNRRYLDETIGRELPRARRLGESVGVIALDIDHFKRLNDTFGHDAGDFVLRTLGEQLRSATRDSDIACRFGGEEFGIILPGASLAAAHARADALRMTIARMRLEFGGKPLGPLTVSAGVACMPPHAQDWTYTLQAADRALYAAKQRGRNTVVAAGMD